MSENENQQSTIASNLCKNGCGFYGSTQFDGMCSVCFKDNMKKKQKQDEEQIQSGKQSPGQHATSFCTVQSSPLSYTDALLESTIQSPIDAASIKLKADEEAEATPLKAGGATTVPVVAQKLETIDDRAKAAVGEAVGQKKRNRCGVCKKKVGLTGFGCRCGGVFCGLHRYSDKHECDFDYQTLGQEEIRKANPLVVSSKIEKL